MSGQLAPELEALLKGRYGHWSSSMRLEMRAVMAKVQWCKSSYRQQVIRDAERLIEQRHFAKLVA